MTVVATCGYEGSSDVAENLARHRAYVDEAVETGAELVVFPECSLHGYPDQSARSSADGLMSTWEIAESITDGANVRALIDHAVARGIHIVFGLNERTDTFGVVFNTAVLAGPQGLIGRYRKVHIGQFERATWAEGDQWPVFDTSIGRIGLLICADKMWPESTRELTLGGAELLVMPTAWAFTIGGTDTMQPCWAEYYLLFDRARAAENARWFISSNFVGSLGDTSFGGYSQIVDPFGTVTASSEDRRGLVFADIDVQRGIAATEAAWLGTRLARDRRERTYRRQTSLAARAEPLHSLEG